MNRKFLGFIAGLLITARLLAHEGHGIPGALPPAPHGGTVQAASDKESGAELEHGHEEGDGHAHGHEGEKEETELFLEGVYKGTELKIYALALMPGNTTSFSKLSAKKVLSNVSLKLEYPRAKRPEVLTPTVAEDAIAVSVDARKVNRFIVYITADFEKETKVAAIQIENE